MNTKENEPAQDTMTAEAEQQKAASEAKQEKGAAKKEPSKKKKEGEEIDRLSKELNEKNEQYIRILAEYDNYRKRSQKEKADLKDSVTGRVLTEFIGTLDNLERALALESSDAEYKKGVDMILTQLKETFTRLGVEEINPVGEAFDPKLHNAVMHIEDEALGENVVSEVFQKGYRLGDTIIRFAMVKVAN